MQSAGHRPRAISQLISREISSDQLMQEVEALEKLGVTEGTLVES